jgi:hypothetical protein
VVRNASTMITYFFYRSLMLIVCDMMREKLWKCNEIYQ